MTDQSDCLKIIGKSEVLTSLNLAFFIHFRYLCITYYKTHGMLRMAMLYEQKSVKSNQISQKKLNDLLDLNDFLALANKRMLYEQIWR